MYNFIRALTRPYPGAFFFNESEKKIICWRSEIIFNTPIKGEDNLILNTADYPVKITDYEVAGQIY